MLMEVRLRVNEMERERVSCGEADCQGERLQFALLTIDEWKYVVIGLHIFPLDFSECSE